MRKKRIEISGGPTTARLVERLGKLRPGLAQQDIVEGATSFLLGEDYVAAYNDEMYIYSQGGLGVEGSVRASPLLKLLSKLPDKAINLAQDGSSLVVKTEGSRFGLPLVEKTELHERVEKLRRDKGKWRKLPKGFVEGLVLCSFYAAKDMTLSPLTDVYVSGKDVLSTDRYRISWHRLKEEIPEMLVPAACAVHLSSYELDEWMQAGSWLRFRGSEFEVGIRLSGEKWKAKVKRHFPKNVGKGIGLPAELKDIIDRAMVIVEDDFLLDKDMTLSFSGNRLACSASKKDMGWIKESVKVKGKVDRPIEINTNPIFLREIMKHSVEMVPGKDRLLFVAGSFRHLISLS